MMTLSIQLVRDEGGQDLIEYALLAGFLAVAALGAVQALGGGIDVFYTFIKERVQEAAQ